MWYTVASLPYIPQFGAHILIHKVWQKLVPTYLTLFEHILGYACSTTA